MQTSIVLSSSPIIVEAFGRPGDSEAFATLNISWLEEYFAIEEEDRRLISDPQTHILDQGGHILLARMNGRVVGVCALIKVDDEAMEFAKMGVEKGLRGRGIGRKLMDAALVKARTLGIKKLLICTNSSLQPALKLYRDAGFVPSTDPRHHHYDRADTFLELVL